MARLDIPNYSSMGMVCFLDPRLEQRAYVGPHWKKKYPLLETLNCWDPLDAFVEQTRMKLYIIHKYKYK